MATHVILSSPSQYPFAQGEGNYDRRPGESDAEYQERRREETEEFDEDNRDDARRNFERDNPSVRDQGADEQLEDIFQNQP